MILLLLLGATVAFLLSLGVQLYAQRGGAQLAGFCRAVALALLFAGLGLLAARTLRGMLFV